MADWQSTPELLALMGLPGVGPAKAVAIARGELDIADLDPDDSLPLLIDRSHQRVSEYESNDVSVIGYFDKMFPHTLRDIPRYPAILYVRGEATWPHQALAVVGTRAPTKFGETAAAELTSAAAARGVAIVSGLAIGIDGIAHEAALAEGGKTIAVLGCGLDAVSPRQHRDLANRILEAGGTIISEQPFGVESSPRTLVARNRLQSGLARALLVAQTGIEGGTLHTVRFAAEQGRPIFCPVPLSPSEANAGLDALLNRPARDLPNVLPAWERHRRLADRLGEAPLARPVVSSATASWVDEITGPLAPIEEDVGEQLTFDS